MVTAGEGRPEPFGVVLIDSARGDVRLEAKTSVGTEGCFRSIDLTLRWHENDPLTVWIDVEAKPDHPALPRGRWVVLRDFLRYGIEQRTGDGDVQVTPDETFALVHLDLARPRRPCRISVPIALLDDFLTQTELRVPLGDERSDELVEAFIAKLLG